MTNPKSRPSGAYYALAAIPMAVALGGFLWLLLADLNSMTTDLKRVIMPGTVRVHLDRTGPHTVFYEYESQVEDRTFRTGKELKEMNCSLTLSATGTRIPLHRGPGSTSYTYSGHYSGYSVLEFALQEPGEYDISCAYAEPTVKDEVVFAIGPDKTGAIFKLVFEAILILFGGLALSALAIVAIERTIRRKPA